MKKKEEEIEQITPPKFNLNITEELAEVFKKWDLERANSGKWMEMFEEICSSDSKKES